MASDMFFSCSTVLLKLLLSYQ